MERPEQRPLVWLNAHAAFIGLGAILIAVFLLYAPTLDDPFHGDDFVAFVEFKSEPFLRYSHDVILFEDSNFYWRPLGKICHRVLFEVVGLDPFIFRLAGLGVFLSTIAALYAFCRRERLSPAVALGAALAFGILPGHVVSVAWVTNTSRLMAVLFFLICLLILQHKGRRESVAEIVAWFMFVAAVCSDETALALAPLPVLYSTFLHDSRLRWRPILQRALAYGLLVAILLPMQFSHTLDDEWRLTFYGIGPHVVTQTWALVSQLVLPSTAPEPWEIMLSSIRPAQWGAGLAAIAAGAVLFVAGSMKLRFLILWTVLSLAPFALWGVLYTSPRYVYMAAVPYSVILAWLCVEGFTYVRAVLAPHLSTPLLIPVSRLTALVVVAAALIPASSALRDRNALWSRETERWGILAGELQREAPHPEDGARIVLFYGNWSDSWASATIWTIYGNHSLSVQVIPAERLDVQYGPFTDRDLVFYSVGDQLLPSTIHGSRRPTIASGIP